MNPNNSIYPDGMSEADVRSGEAELQAKATTILPRGEAPTDPLPWNAHFPDGSNGYWRVGSKSGDEVATCYSETAGGSANLIAVAVNSHAALLAAVTESQALLARWIVPGSDLDDRAVLSALLGILDDRDLVELVRGAK